MAKCKRKRAPKSVLKLPDLEQSRSAILNSLTSQSSQRTYDHAKESQNQEPDNLTPNDTKYHLYPGMA